jgi:hypothetical protein
MRSRHDSCRAAATFVCEMGGGAGPTTRRRSRARHIGGYLPRRGSGEPYTLNAARGVRPQGNVVSIATQPDPLVGRGFRARKRIRPPPYPRLSCAAHRRTGAEAGLSQRTQSTKSNRNDRSLAKTQEQLRTRRIECHPESFSGKFVHGRIHSSSPPAPAGIQRLCWISPTTPDCRHRGDDAVGTSGISREDHRVHDAFLRPFAVVCAPRVLCESPSVLPTRRAGRNPPVGVDRAAVMSIVHAEGAR